LFAKLVLTLRRQTLATWERRTGECFITMSVKWYKTHYTNIARACVVISQLADVVATTAHFVSYAVHTVRCDGTNSALARGSKAHVLELRSAFRHASLVDLRSSSAQMWKSGPSIPTLPAFRTTAQADMFVL
jgi:hypothetical protein